MKRAKIAIVTVVFLVAGMAVWTLAKPPGGGGSQNCKIVSCAQCPEGYYLQQPQVWPNCCVCVPAP